VNETNVAPTSASPPAAATQSDIPSTSLIQLSPRVSRSPARSLKEEEEEEKRCWICYTSEAEEEAPKSDWKSPCKCTLVAHESCLLEWIADLQRPENNSGGRIACPQCKTQIRLRERRSIVLELVEGVSRIIGRAVPVLLLAGLCFRTSWDGAPIAPGVKLMGCVLGVGSVVFVGCTVYGMI
jgi:hypothetical protein